MLLDCLSSKRHYISSKSKVVGIAPILLAVIKCSHRCLICIFAIIIGSRKQSDTDLLICHTQRYLHFSTKHSFKAFFSNFMRTYYKLKLVRLNVDISTSKLFVSKNLSTILCPKCTPAPRRLFSQVSTEAIGSLHNNPVLI